MQGKLKAAGKHGLVENIEDSHGVDNEGCLMNDVVAYTLMSWERYLKVEQVLTHNNLRLFVARVVFRVEWK